MEYCAAQNGSFDILGLPAGEYQLVARIPALGATTFRVEVEHEDLDLGELRLPATGTLRVTNRWPETDIEGRRLYYRLIAHVPSLHGGHESVECIRIDRHLEGDMELLPGEVSILVGVEGKWLQERRVEIRSTSITEMELGLGLPFSNVEYPPEALPVIDQIRFEESSDR